MRQIECLKWDLFLFSATIPREILEIAKKYLKEDYHLVKIDPENPTLENIFQKVYQTGKHQRFEKLIQILKVYAGNKTIIFTHTKREADQLAQELRSQSFKANALHGDYSQRRREEILKGFKRGEFAIPVATDVASRGLDIKDVELIVNYGLPRDTNAYIHRIGRTGRAGHKGSAISLMLPEERKYLKSILIKTRGKINLYE